MRSTGGSRRARIFLPLASALLAFATFPASLRANRPLNTEDAVVIPAGKGQLEMSWDYAATFGESRDQVFLAVPGFGIANRVEFTLELPFVLDQQEGAGWTEGVGDIRATAKVLLVPEKKFVPAIALQGYFKFNTGNEDEGAGTGEREAGFFAIASKQVGDFLLHGMIGLDFDASGPNQGQSDVIYGVAVDYEVGKIAGRPFHLVTEVFGDTGFDPAISFGPAIWLLGAVYELSEAWALDCGIGVSLAGSGSDLNTTVGVTYLFP